MFVYEFANVSKVICGLIKNGYTNNDSAIQTYTEIRQIALLRSLIVIILKILNNNMPVVSN